MRIKSDQFEQGAFYHLYNHSAKGELLFRDEEDYRNCIGLMRQLISPDFFAVCAYCLMPNHYHILIYQHTDQQVNKPFFQIWQRYSRYYNHKYNEFGSIFCQKLQHAWVSNDSYLVNLCVYIHMNPVSAGIVDKPGDWLWSDYLDWIGERKDPMFNPLVRDLFVSDPEAYRKIISGINWAKMDDKILIDNR